MFPYKARVPENRCKPGTGPSRPPQPRSRPVMTTPSDRQQCVSEQDIARRGCLPTTAGYAMFASANGLALHKYAMTLALRGGGTETPYVQVCSIVGPTAHHPLSGPPRRLLARKGERRGNVFRLLQRPSRRDVGAGRAGRRGRGSGGGLIADAAADTCGHDPEYILGQRVFLCMVRSGSPTPNVTPTLSLCAAPLRSAPAPPLPLLFSAPRRKVKKKKKKKGHPASRYLGKPVMSSPPETLSLAGKAAIVTGSGRTPGLGRASRRRLRATAPPSPSTT